MQLAQVVAVVRQRLPRRARVLLLNAMPHWASHSLVGQLRAALAEWLFAYGAKLEK